MQTPRFLTVILLAAAALAAAMVPAQAQGNLFAPVAYVNDRVVTQYELNQRALFYEALRAPGDTQERAMETLVNERLQQDAAATLGVTVSEEDIASGLAEFAARANLEPDQFLVAIGEVGVQPETVYDFVKAGLLWRGVVRSRFGPRTQVTEAEIDRAIAIGTQDGTEAPGGVRVLLSEIFLPTNTPEAAALAQQRAAEISRIDTIPAFAAAARQYSAAPSRNNGGRQNWIDLSKLPSEVRGQILGLAPGQVTAPIQVPNAIAIFQLRALEETGAPAENAVAVEFARFFIPGGRTEKTLAEARKIEAEVDTCDDLYGVARKLPPERLLRDTLPIAEISGDIALELARLDEGEVSTALTTADGGALVFLMLCGRTMGLAEEVDREQIRQQLINQRLAAYASGYLAELEADAHIVYP